MASRRCSGLSITSLLEEASKQCSAWFRLLLPGQPDSVAVCVFVCVCVGGGGSCMNECGSGAISFNLELKLDCSEKYQFGQNFISCRP